MAKKTDIANQEVPGKDIPDKGRRDFLRAGLMAGIGIFLGAIGVKSFADAIFPKSISSSVWQIDPRLCVHCGRCGKSCVLRPSAVKAVHAYDVCGYCDLCGAYIIQGARELTTAAENQLCPAGALKRSFVEDPYYEYTISEKACVACAKCVRACTAFGNGSLFLQIRHDRCVNCNECSCARQCPAGAIKRVPRSSPYILKKGAKAVSKPAK